MYAYITIGSLLYIIFLLNLPLFHDLDKGTTHLKVLRIVMIIPIIGFLFFLTIFRSLEVGTDYLMYHNFYLNGDYIDLFGSFVVFIYDFARQEGNFLIFTFVLTSLFLLFNVLAIKKISRSFYVSFTFFVLSFYYFYIYNGMRQAVAISILFLGIYYIQKEKLALKDFFIYALLVALAMQFHFSVVYMLPLFLLRFLKVNKLMIVIAFFITTIGYFLPFTKDIYTNLLLNFDFYVQKYENQPDAFFGVNKDKGVLEFIPVIVQYIFLYYALTLKQMKSIADHFVISYYLGFLIFYAGSGIEAIDRIQFYFYPSIVLFYDYLIFTIYAKGNRKVFSSASSIGKIVALASVSFWFLYFLIRVLQGTHGIYPYELMG